MVKLVHLSKALIVLAFFGFAIVTLPLIFVKTNSEVLSNVRSISQNSHQETENKKQIMRFWTEKAPTPKPQNSVIDIVYTWVNGSDPEFLKNLKVYSASVKKSKELAGRRFRDKNELRFSLRSIEKYASWVNHVYIVTNGQIPYWLNTSYEKVSIVTHEQIFKNVTNLPTFSSPAIESNLHRIPGISKQFIYFNDDILLGQPVSEEDFYTEKNGYKVFLAWPVPNCKQQCPWSKVKDGKCQAACNNTECQYDGGDCSKDHIIPAYDRKKVKTSNLDGYGASILHSQRLLNLRYGFKDRKVAAHAPIMIDRDIMNKLQEVYNKEFQITESNSVRADDIQFEFFYYSFLTSEKNDNHTMDEIFAEFDKDKSGSWSQDEILAFLKKIDSTKFTNSPPDIKTIEDFKAKINNCCSVKNNSTDQSSINFTILHRECIDNCTLLRIYIIEKMDALPKYNFEIIKKSESIYSTMERLISNVSKVKTQLKKLSSKMTKFVCINDDLDDAKPKENKAIEAMLQNFYLSQFPLVSAFEVTDDLAPIITKLKVEEIRQNNVIVILCILILTVLLLLCIYLFCLRWLTKLT